MAVIEVTHFKKSFGTKVIHEDVTFYVKKGECLGLIGGSGAGKSVARVSPFFTTVVSFPGVI